MGLFSKASADTSIKREDRVGGFTPLDSNVYPYEIVQAYATESEKGALGVVLEFNLDVGAEKPRKLNQTIYLTDSTGKTYWEKEGRKGNLPGFEIVDDLVALATEGGSILDDDLNSDEKTIQIKKNGVNTPTQVQVLTDLIGAKGELAILNEIVDETKKSDATGQYEKTGQTKVQNTIIKVLAETGHTTNELRSETEEPIYKKEWLNAWEGKQKNSAKGDGKTAVASKAASAGASKPKSSLFANRK